MNYYLYNESKKELSSPITEQWIAETQLSKLHKSTRDKTKVIAIPEIKEGLKLFKGNIENPKYYETIVGSSGSSWVCDYTDGSPRQDPQDMFIKDNLFKLFLTGKLANIELYEEDKKYKHVHVDNKLSDGEEVDSKDDGDMEI